MSVKQHVTAEEQKSASEAAQSCEAANSVGGFGFHISP
jgi:hypothetical protein